VHDVVSSILRAEKEACISDWHFLENSPSPLVLELLKTLPT
jgi:hypothetical protein